MKETLLVLLLVVSCKAVTSQIQVTRNGLIYEHDCTPKTSNINGSAQTIILRREHKKFVMYDKMSPYLIEQTFHYSKNGLLDSANTVSRSFLYKDGTHQDTIIKGKEHYDYDDQKRIIRYQGFEDKGFLGKPNRYEFEYGNSLILCTNRFITDQDSVITRTIYTDTLFEGTHGLDSIIGKWRIRFNRDKNGRIHSIEEKSNIDPSNKRYFKYSISYQGKTISKVIVDFGDLVSIEKYNKTGDLISEENFSIDKSSKKTVLISQRSIRYKYDSNKNWIFREQSYSTQDKNNSQNSNWELNFTEYRTITYFPR